MELGNVAIGSEAMVDLKLEGGAVKVTVSYVGADADAQVVVAIKPQAFVAKLKEMIPGQIDDMVFDLMLAQLNK